MTRFSALCLFSLLTIFAGATSADQTFTDEAAFQSSLTGAQVQVDYSALSGLGPIDEVVGPLSQPFGSLDFGASGFADSSGELPQVVPGFAPDLTTPIGLLFDGSNCVQFNIDASNGPLEGFGVFAAGPLGVDITVYDGATVVASLAGVGTNATPEDTFFGWTNCNGASVTSIEVCSSDSTPFNAVIGGTLSFSPVSNEEPSCQAQLQSIIDGLMALSASEQDQYWIDYAISDLTCAQDSIYWADENLLSDHGTGFFGNVFWATYSLECVADGALVSESLIEIQDLLSCVVEAEIAFALENPDANNYLLEYAQYFEDYANQFADAEFYLQAVLLHFYAWLFAHFA